MRRRMTARGKKKTRLYHVDVCLAESVLVDLACSTSAPRTYAGATAKVHQPEVATEGHQPSQVSRTPSSKIFDFALQKGEFKSASQEMAQSPGLDLTDLAGVVGGGGEGTSLRRFAPPRKSRLHTPQRSGRLAAKAQAQRGVRAA